ncbi:hypothetical protein H2198_010628 [Neophaeococcomyces mojaviensis]|uniref:Uncharacterized protein n=1 Tax=Neophaeococcomyces mojaviensis TaxID=3383035 RepID=A0ACC2ZRG1_9EURO|nr:hypothetical protein H2198_010628 [Knufia sp. JES_112]
MVCYVSTPLPRLTETVSLAVGGNGFVDLEISRPQTHLKRNKILVHLPAGPFPNGSAPKPTAIFGIKDIAKDFSDTTLINLRYRLSSQSAQQELDHRFPTPIHDVFAAWDYITDHHSPHNHGFSNNRQPKICLYGANIGGALALTLALTNPAQIHAVAIEEPLVDWPILDELADVGSNESSSTLPIRMKSATRKHGEREALAVAAEALIKLRTNLFRTPSGYFDSFASPTLFLRAPGRDTPITKTAAPLEEELVVVDGATIRYGEEEDEIGLVEYDGNAFGPYDDDWHTVEIPNHARRHSILKTANAVDTSLSADDSNESTEQPTTDLSYWTAESVPEQSPAPPRRRKVLRRWPPVAQLEDVVLPYVNIILSHSQPPNLSDSGEAHYTDISPVVRTQGIELLELLRRACFWGREKGVAEERVILMELDVDDPNRRDHVIEYLRSRLNNA